MSKPLINIFNKSTETEITQDWSLTIIVIIIIILFNLIAHRDQNKVDSRKTKKASSIQYGYKRKCKSGTYVFPNTCDWEQQERKKTKKQNKARRKD